MKMNPKGLSGVRYGGLVVCMLCLMPECAAEPMRILFYGNSFTNGTSGSTRSVPDLVKDIAVAAGHAVPQTVNGASSSKDFAWHLENGLHWITDSLPPGQTWDVVVLQNHTSMPTHIGNVAQHRADAVKLYEKVAEHSPDVTPVMYQTWARAVGHAFYTGSPPDFPGGPAQMQAELREGYQLAAEDIDAKAGMSIAKVAAVGDAWEAANWQNLHAPDLQHAQNRGTLLAALVIYSTIYDDPTTSDINLSGVLRSLRLLHEDGQFLTGVVDSLNVPEPSSAACAAVAFGGLMLLVPRFDRCYARRRYTSAMLWSGYGDVQLIRLARASESHR